MKLELLIDQFELVTDTEEGFEQLRSIILDLAVRGKLTKQIQKDVPASNLLKTIKRKREELYEKGEIRKQSDLPEITKDEIPYELPQNWSWERLGNVGIVNPRIDADEDLEASFVPMKLISEDYSGRHDFEVRMWSDIRRGYTHFGEKDVGMAKITPCFENGKAAIFRNLKNGIGAGTTELYVFRAIPDTILPEYVYSFVQSARFKALGKAKMTGTAGQQRVPRNYFEEALFPLPPFEEQHRIVQKIETLFSQVDELEKKVRQDREVDERLQVAVLDDLQRAETPEASKQSWQRLTDHFEQIYRKPEHIDQLKQAILNEAVRGRLVPQDFSDQINSELVERVNSKNGITEKEVPFEIPDNWIWCKYKDVARLRHGHQFRKHDYVENGIPVIKIGQCKPDGSLDLSDCNYIDKSREEEFENKLIHKGDLLMALTGGTLGKVTRVDKDYGTIVQNYRVGNFIPNESFLALDYLNIVLESELFQSLVRKEINQNAQPNIGKSSIENILMAMPPLAEQKRIYKKTKELITWCDDLKEKLSRSQQTDQRLLEALVNGG